MPFHVTCPKPYPNISKLTASKNQGPLYRPKTVGLLFQEHPKNDLPNLWKQPVGPWHSLGPWPALTRLFSGILFCFHGFWAPIVLPLSPKKNIVFSQGSLNNLVNLCALFVSAPGSALLGRPNPRPGLGLRGGRPCYVRYHFF